ncbi:MAG TPA: cytochrome c, partial [Thermoanaerobaculia bacterium]|nr:cytochrome c [Thermoanaerobaculia bacterium]
NCLACHGGEVAGQVIVGLGNTQQDVQTLLEDLAALRAKGRGADPEAARANATLGFPMNFARGVTNATQYSILLGAMRDEHLDLVFPPSVSQDFVHNDVDAPAWWHFRKKRRIYFDGMAPKTVRTLMQFTMAPGLPGEKIRGWEDELTAIRDTIASLEPPAWPYQLDRELAERGRAAFEATCSRCHGTYGETATYPGEVVPYSLVNTDPVRLDAISRESRQRYNRSWFSSYGAEPVELESRGYVAPPLDGVWASAPYFHNGSVPTLWHVLHPDQRPAVWRGWGTAESDYDPERVGLRVDVLERVPKGLSPRERRGYYDTAVISHDAGGHRFPDLLDDDAKRAVLEYLKTL